MDMFSALAEPTRRDIIELIARKGGLPATEIYDNFDVSHPAISQHLQVLREAKLVMVEKLAQKRIYTLNPKTINEFEKWARHMTKEWDVRLDALDKVLEKEKIKTHNKKGNGHGRQ
jgi:DNA-binding transcriptional ArsR family regulator